MIVAVLLAAVLCISARAGDDPVAHGPRDGPDAELLGRSKGYPIGTRTSWWQEEFRVGSFSGMDRIHTTRTVGRSSRARALEAAASPPELRYTHEGVSRSLDDYLARRRITGLLVLLDGRILYERYQYGRTASDRMLSHSVAKSVTSLAVGCAARDGKIRSLDDPASSYAPALAGSAYGDTSIRHLLRMSSGVRFTEDYGGKDDCSRFLEVAFREGTVAALRGFTERDVEAGKQFRYASSETAALGVVVARAVGKSLSDYVAEAIWKPMGAESDATWVLDARSGELALGYLSATLRDYGRLGALLATDGVRDGRQVLPKDYLLEATDHRRHPAAFAPGAATPYFGYGYQFWTFPGAKRRFALLGIYEQSIQVDPETRLVMVQTSVGGKDALDPGFAAERDAVWRGLVGRFGAW